MQAIYENRIFLTQRIQKLFNFEWNILISLLPFHTILKHYHFPLFLITSKQVELGWCRLHRVLANLKGFIYVTDFSMIRWVSFRVLRLNVAKEGIKLMARMVWNAITPEYSRGREWRPWYSWGMLKLNIDWKFASSLNSVGNFWSKKKPKTNEF